METQAESSSAEKPWTKDQNEQYIKENVEQFTGLITSRIIPELRHLLTVLDTGKPCKQFQLALMDVDALAENLASIHEDGYLPRLKEVPLSASEITEEFVFPDDDAELVYTEEHQTESGHHVPDHATADVESVKL